MESFNVRSIISVCCDHLLSLDPQTKLAMNAYATVSELRHNVTNIAMVSDVHRAMVKGQEGSDDKNMSDARSLSITELSPTVS